MAATSGLQRGAVGHQNGRHERLAARGCRPSKWPPRAACNGGSTMTVIDADAHVIETDRTWDHMHGEDERFRPQTVSVPGPNGNTDMWLMEGRLVSKGPAGVTDTDKAMREMDDIDGRLRHMDQLGTDVH